MIKRVFLCSLLLITAAWAQEEMGPLTSQFNDGRKEILNGQIGSLLTLRFADLGTCTYDKSIFVQEAKIRPGETKGYKAKFSADVSEVVIGVEYRNDKYEANAFLEVKMDGRINPFLRGNVNSDTECRAEKIDGSGFTGTVFCAFDTRSKGEGTLFIWVTGRRFTTYNLYVAQNSDKPRN